MFTCAWRVRESALLFCTGVLGIKVKIMLPHDPTGKMGPKRPLPDQVSVVEPKEEQHVSEPYSEQKGGKPFDHAAAAIP